MTNRAMQNLFLLKYLFIRFLTLWKTQKKITFSYNFGMIFRKCFMYLLHHLLGIKKAPNYFRGFYGSIWQIFNQ